MKTYSRLSSDATNDIQLLSIEQQFTAGAWVSLIHLAASEHLDQHAERATLALYIAAAFFQSGDLDQGKHWLQHAQDWGIAKKDAARILLSGAHNTLARIYLAQNDWAHALTHYRASVEVGQPELDPALSVWSRVATECESMNLPPISRTQLSHSGPRLFVANTPSFDPALSPAQLIVLGMHRSGTSCLTGLLHVLGAYVSTQDVAMPPCEENQKGFFERRDFCKITQSILEKAGGDWHEVTHLKLKTFSHEKLISYKKQFEEILNCLNQHAIWALKDPRLCLLLPQFLDQLKNPIIIHIYRNPIEVAKSLAVRNHFSLTYGAALWEFYHSHAFRNARGLPQILLSYEDLLKTPAETAAMLHDILSQDFGISVPALNQTAVLEWVEHRLHRSCSAPIESDRSLTGSQRALWDAMRSGSILNKNFNIMPLTEHCLDTLRISNH